MKKEVYDQIIDASNKVIETDELLKKVVIEIKMAVAGLRRTDKRGSLVFMKQAAEDLAVMHEGFFDKGSELICRMTELFHQIQQEEDCNAALKE